MTIEDLYTLPEDRVTYELQAGTLLSEPHPGVKHGRVVMLIAAVLLAHVRAHRLGVVLVNDTWFLLSRDPDTVRAPDVAYITRQRFEESGDPAGAFPGAPDLAVEVLSTSNTPSQVRAKVADYLAAGTRCVWVADVSSQSVTAYRSLLAPRTLLAEDILDGEDVLPGFRVNVGELFEPLDSRADY
jgi:Uma2 family endonuclease